MQAKHGNQTKVFYTMPEYESWKEEVGSARGWTIKYYKGLGTSTGKEAKEYFAALDSHRKTFIWEGVTCFWIIPCNLDTSRSWEEHFSSYSIAYTGYCAEVSKPGDTPGTVVGFNCAQIEMNHSLIYLAGCR